MVVKTDKTKDTAFKFVREMIKLDDKIRNLTAMKYELENALVEHMLRNEKDSKLNEGEMVLYDDEYVLKLQRKAMVDADKFMANFGELDHIDAEQYKECVAGGHYETVYTPAKAYLRPIKKYLVKQGGKAKDLVEECLYYGNWRAKIDTRKK